MEGTKAVPPKAKVVAVVRHLRQHQHHEHDQLRHLEVVPYLSGNENGYPAREPEKNPDPKNPNRIPPEIFLIF